MMHQEVLSKKPKKHAQDKKKETLEIKPVNKRINISNHPGVFLKMAVLEILRNPQR